MLAMVNIYKCFEKYNKHRKLNYNEINNQVPKSIVVIKKFNNKLFDITNKNNQFLNNYY